MTMIRVTVTAEDIARGRAGSVRYCFFALALARATGREVVTVWPCSAYLGLPERGAREVALPSVATKAISAFESGLTVQPFECEVQA